MRVLIQSEAPFMSTGYGIPCRQVAALLAEAGHEVIISAIRGLNGKELNMGPIRVLAAGMDQGGNDLLPLRYRHLNPDVVLALHDVWVLSPDTLRTVPVAAWTPVDTQPISAVTLRALSQARWALAYSKFGEREMRKAGLDPLYCPLGYDGELYQPMDRQKARAALQVDPETYFVVFVGSNMGNPPRKSPDRVIQAWAKFNAAHPGSRLYMHTNPLPNDGGLNLIAMAKFYGVPETALQFADAYKLHCGAYADETLALILAAADVLIAPSRGEGFGMVPVQAQAVGTPVIVPDFSAQAELCFDGYAIPVDPFDDLEWHPAGAEVYNPTPDKLLPGLEWGLEHKGDLDLRARVSEAARAYEVRSIFDRYTLPVLQYVADVHRSEHPQHSETVEPSLDATQEVAA